MELSLTPKNMPSISGNFDTYKADLIKQIEGYKSSPLTDETVAPVKSAIRQIRTTLEKIESTAVSTYFDSPKKILKAQFAELYSIIADGESKVDAIIAEDTRKRNTETTERLIGYIASKVKSMTLESDAVDYVVFEKTFYNKTAKEIENLNNIDAQLTQLEKNFAAYVRAEKKIQKLAATCGPVFNKARYLNYLSKYGEGNDEFAAQAEEEAERLSSIPPEAVAAPAVTKKMPIPVSSGTEEISIEFPSYDKKKSKGSEDVAYLISIPKEAKKQFAELLKQLGTVGIKCKKI